MKKYLFILLLCFITELSCFCQASLRFDHFGVEQGLSQSVIYTIFQDSKGFLWIGTHDGLNRYDGYDFKKFYNDPLDSNSLAENIVYQIQEDATGCLWIKTIHYLHRFNPVTNQFNRYKIPTTSQQQNFPIQKPICNKDLVPVDNYFNAWVFHIPSARFILLTYPDGSLYKSSGTQHNNIQRYKGALLAPGKAGLCFFDTTSLHLETLSSDPFAAEQIVYLQSCGEQLMGINKKGYLLNGFNGVIVREPLLGKDTTANSIAGITVDTRNVAWVATNQALYNILLHEGRLQKIDLRFSNNQPASNADNKCLTSDKQGNLWLGSFGDGMRKINLQQGNIINFGYGSTANALPGKFVQSIAEASSGEMYATFYETNAVAKIEAGSKRITNLLPHQYLNNANIAKLLLKKSFDDFKKLPQFDSLLRKTNYFNVNNPLLYRDSKGILWQRSEFSLAAHSPKIELNIGSLIERYIETPDANIWMATSANGLAYWNRKTQQLRFFTKEQGLSSNNINALLYDSVQYCLWLGTHLGLNKFDLQNNRIQTWDSKDGLCHNSVYNMVMDAVGHLWLGTGNGISRFDPSQLKFKNFNRRDGLLNIEYNRYCAIRLQNGMLAFGGTQGIDLFDPTQMNVRNAAPNVLITGVKIFDREIFPAADHLTLLHNENNLTISFAAMDFTNPAKTRYAYQLKGTDKDWIYGEGIHSVSYAALEAGDYIFLVKAANDAGEWSDTYASLHFTIQKVWWQTGWFYVALALLLAAIGYIFLRYRWKKKVELLQIRNRIHRDLHDDVGATLSTMKAYTAMLKERPGQNEFLELISENADNMLDKLELITWASNPSNDSMQRLIEKIQQLLTPVFYHKGIDLNVFAEPTLKNLELPGLVRQNLFLLLKEAANNCIKYAAANSCSIRITKEGNCIVLQFKDDGKGFDVNAVTKGNGLKNMAARATELKGTFAIQSSFEMGTTLRVNIPYPFKINLPFTRKK